MKGLFLVLMVLPVVGLVSSACQKVSEFDVVIRGGTLYDGTGGAPIQGDIGILGDRIAAIGDLDGRRWPV